jgi:DNA-binding NarL/FixJ family response regulator
MPERPSAAARAGRASGAPEAPPVTVLTVDDQPVFRRAMASLVEATPGFVHVGEAASGREALALAAVLHPDLVLLDVRMPEMDGIETARRLAAAERRPAIVLISLDEVPELEAAPRAGAAVYLRKQELSTRRLRELWAAISTSTSPRSTDR